MTQYNSLNVKLPNSQLNKLKSAIKDGTDVILRLSSNICHYWYFLDKTFTMKHIFAMDVMI